MISLQVTCPFCHPQNIKDTEGLDKLADIKEEKLVCIVIWSAYEYNMLQNFGNVFR